MKATTVKMNRLNPQIIEKIRQYVNVSDRNLEESVEAFFEYWIGAGWVLEDTNEGYEFWLTVEMISAKMHELDHDLEVYNSLYTLPGFQGETRWIQRQISLANYNMEKMITALNVLASR